MADDRGIDPGYGGYNTTNQLLAAAGNGPDQVNQWMGVAQKKQQLTQSQFDLAKSRLDTFHQLARSMLADSSMQNITDTVGQAVSAGAIPPEMGNAAIAKVSGMNDAQRKQWAYQQVMTLSDHDQAISAAYGTPGTLNLGGRVQSVRTVTGPNAGTYQAGGGSATLSQDPNGAAAITTLTDAQGRTYQVTSRQAQAVVGDQGSQPVAGGGFPPQPSGNALSTYMPNANGGAPALPNGGNALTRAGGSTFQPAQSGDPVANPIGGARRGSPARPTIAGPAVARTAAGAPQNVDPNGNAIGPNGQPNVAPNLQRQMPAQSSQPWAGAMPGLQGPAAGQLDAAKVSGVASAEQGVGLQKVADGAPIRKAMLANLNDDLDKFTSGPGADWQQVGKAWANRNVLPQSMQFDPQSIASQESFNKQATQLAQQQFQTLGGTGTDSQLASTFKANPNQALSQLGNRQIIQLLRGNEDAIQAKANAWQDWQSKNGSASYGAFQQDFNKTYNPRVYQAMYMDPQQIADMRKNMSPAEQQQFARDYTALKRKGYITPGGTGGQ